MDTSMYPDFARVADEEGFEDVAAAFAPSRSPRSSTRSATWTLAANIEAGRVFKRAAPATWRCRNCGYLHVGLEAPELCPACLHPQAHFELLGENW